VPARFAVARIRPPSMVMAAPVSEGIGGSGVMTAANSSGAIHAAPRFTEQRTVEVPPASMDDGSRVVTRSSKRTPETSEPQDAVGVTNTKASMEPRMRARYMGGPPDEPWSGGTIHGCGR
jgi:hypothetical protein